MYQISTRYLLSWRGATAVIKRAHICSAFCRVVTIAHITLLDRWIAPFLPPETSHSLRAMLNQLVHVGMVEIEYRKYDWSINQLQPQPTADTTQPTNPSQWNDVIIRYRLLPLSWFMAFCVLPKVGSCIIFTNPNVRTLFYLNVFSHKIFLSSAS